MLPSPAQRRLHFTAFFQPSSYKPASLLPFTCDAFGVRLCFLLLFLLSDVTLDLCAGALSGIPNFRKAGTIVPGLLCEAAVSLDMQLSLEIGS